MRNIVTLLVAAGMMLSGAALSQSVAEREKKADFDNKVDTRVDNNRYWKLLAEQGLVKLNPVIPVEPATYVGSEIRSFTSITEDSPDVPVAPYNSTQSENSIFVHPDNNQLVINSNNSTTNPYTTIYGANALKTEDGGGTWGGVLQGAGGNNSGDPVALIGLNGTYFIGFISSSGGQAVARSTNNGATYTVHNVANSPWGGLLDKNHMWIDNSPSSPYNGHLYNAWTNFGGTDNYEVSISRSINDGVSWSTPVNISSAVNAGSHCQGVNINTGPDGQVYAIWVIYDGWPTDETAIGMARSLDGGATWLPATRIITNIRGIRTTSIGKNMRKNSFPSMAVDISGGERNGNIYVVWANIGVPGINTGSDVDVYMSRSENQGLSWSSPVRVNQDPIGLGKKHYFPWITCDPETGILSVVFYDDRNVGSTQCEVYCANSFDGGLTWEDFKVSDVSFTPSPIPGLADGYMGDYLGINARGGWVYPSWTDNRTGSVMTYVSPYQTNPLARPEFLTATVEFETGIASLEWEYVEEPGFTHFNIYRGDDIVGTSTETAYDDQLPDYGVYSYKVTAYYEGIGESIPTAASTQWGDAQISAEPAAITQVLHPDSSIVRHITIHNVGQLPMNYHITMFIPSVPMDDNRDYCAASGGCDEFISRVQLNEINNISNCTGYGNYTNQSANMSMGTSYQITVFNGNPDSQDKCGLWIDWNQNEVFDADESITMSGSPGIGPYSAEITPPDNAKSGSTRLRTRIVYSGSPEPCGNSTYGEVEDYTINVLGWLIITPTAGSIAAGESMQLAVTLSATDIEMGTYTADINIFSNDPDDPMVTIPLTLVVSDLNVDITAEQEVLCQGENVTLTPVIEGGFGEFTYSWTSDPEGFFSEDLEPVVSPETTTTYFLEVTDGNYSISNQITIVVNPRPQVELGADVAICQGETLLITPGEEYTSYLWSTGETTTAITADASGEYWVEVSNEFGCVNRDTLTLTVNPLPVVNLGEDQLFCEGGSVMLSAGTGYSSYFWNNGATSYYISANEPGEYWVMVTDENNCSGQDTIMLTMNPLPQAPEISSGPVSVDNFLSPVSDFVSSASAHATAYEWKLEPAEAGMISGSGTSAQVTWMAGYTGTAFISARGLNDCGESAFSASHEVAVFSSQNIDDRKSISGIRIFPNPNNGSFTLQFGSDKDQEVRIKLITSNGHQIMDNKESVSAGLYQKTFNLSSLPGGTYTLLISDKDGRLISRQQVVMQ